MFGQQPAQSNNLFANNQQAPSLFNNPQPSFGQQQPPANNILFQQPQQQTNNLFAQPTSNPPLFGQQQPQQNPLFGQQPTQTQTTGLFQTVGQPQVQNSFQPSIFGQTQQQQPIGQVQQNQQNQQNQNQQANNKKSMTPLSNVINLQQVDQTLNDTDKINNQRKIKYLHLRSNFNFDSFTIRPLAISQINKNLNKQLNIRCNQQNTLSSHINYQEEILKDIELYLKKRKRKRLEDKCTSKFKIQNIKLISLENYVIQNDESTINSSLNALFNRNQKPYDNIKKKNVAYLKELIKQHHTVPATSPYRSIEIGQGSSIQNILSSSFWERGKIDNKISKLFLDQSNNMQSIIEILEGLEGLNTNFSKEYNLLKHQLQGVDLSLGKNQVKLKILNNTVDKIEKDFQAYFIQRRETLEINQLNRLFMQIYSCLLTSEWQPQMILINGVYIGGVMFLLYRAGLLSQSTKMIKQFILNSGSSQINKEIERLLDFSQKQNFTQEEKNYIYKDLCGKNTKIDCFMRQIYLILTKIAEQEEVFDPQLIHKCQDFNLIIWMTIKCIVIDENQEGPSLIPYSTLEETQRVIPNKDLKIMIQMQKYREVLFFIINRTDQYFNFEISILIAIFQKLGIINQEDIQNYERHNKFCENSLENLIDQYPTESIMLTLLLLDERNETSAQKATQIIVNAINFKSLSGELLANKKKWLDSIKNQKIRDDIIDQAIRIHYRDICSKIYAEWKQRIEDQIHQKLNNPDLIIEYTQQAIQRIEDSSNLLINALNENQVNTVTDIHFDIVSLFHVMEWSAFLICSNGLMKSKLKRFNSQIHSRIRGMISNQSLQFPLSPQQAKLIQLEAYNDFLLESLFSQNQQNLDQIAISHLQNDNYLQQLVNHLNNTKKPYNLNITFGTLKSLASADSRIKQLIAKLREYCWKQNLGVWELIGEQVSLPREIEEKIRNMLMS